MNKPPRSFLISCFSLCLALLSACSAQAPVPTLTPTAPPPTGTPTGTSTPTVTFTPSATMTPTITRTPPALPTPYRTSLLNSLDTPHTYVPDTCQYLHDKWSSASSTPGTMVMVIMFHSIMKPGDTVGPNQISKDQFTELMGGLESHGFEAINTNQLAGFLEHNAKIPSRSVILIVDDRHHAQYFDTYFREFWEADQWPVVNAWISASRDNLDAALWQEQEGLNAEGWVDYQAHGVVHNTPMWPGASDTYITSELQGSIDAFKVHFNKVPIAIIWPGGGFSPRAAQIARQLGYRLGFTVNPRGPLMFNWVPLSDTVDPRRPSWAPEGPVKDPLMVLPRYWDTDAIIHLDEVVQIGQEAAAYAQANKSTELDYYDIVCSSTYGPIP